ncbi:MAG: TlpA disulfide reductase family protein [Marinifilaceae bacterium]|nr:TlpA disulfide reductase family protein [Marinifilaceae bacterium]
MKRILVLGCLMMSFVGLFGQSETISEDCVIRGVLDGVYKGKKVYLVEEKEINGESWVVDSCDVVDNQYTFVVKDCGVPRMYFVKSGDPECLSPITPVWVERGTVRVKANSQFFLNSDVVGTPNNEIFSAYRATQKFHIDSVNRAARVDMLLNRNQSDEARAKDFKARTDFHNRRNLELQEELVKRYSDQAIAPFMIFWEMRANVSLDELKKLRALVDPSLNEHPYTRQLDEYIRLAEFKVGSDMPDFNLPDKDGNLFKLSSLRGKYVLIDFWASWCGPCMREMPNVVKLYKECKGKNFEIVGVSLDQKRDAWLNAVEKNKMKWIQVSDLKSWGTPPVKLCNVTAVPYTVLIDPQGKVIALDLRGEELIKKVKEVLNK